MTVSKEQLEAKFREVEETVGRAEEELVGKGTIVAVVAVAAVVGIVAYSVWRARRRRIRVEVYYQR